MIDRSLYSYLFRLIQVQTNWQNVMLCLGYLMSYSDLQPISFIRFEKWRSQNMLPGRRSDTVTVYHKHTFYCFEHYNLATRSLAFLSLPNIIRIYYQSVVEFCYHRKEDLCCWRLTLLQSHSCILFIHLHCCNFQFCKDIVQRQLSVGNANHVIRWSVGRFLGISPLLW